MISDKRVKELEIFATEIRLESMKAFTHLGLAMLVVL